VTSAFRFGTLSYNQNINTVMSYNTGPATTSGSPNYGHDATPMAFDIAAIQFLYGANTSYHTGTDIYFCRPRMAPAQPGNASGMPAHRRDPL